MKYVAVKSTASMTVLLLIFVYLPAEGMAYVYNMRFFIAQSKLHLVAAFNILLGLWLFSVILLPFLTSNLVRCFGAILFYVNTLLIIAYSEIVGTSHLTQKFLNEIFDLFWGEGLTALRSLPSLAYREGISNSSIEIGYLVQLFDLLWRERVMALEVLPLYTAQILPALILMLLVALIFCAPPPKALRLGRWWNSVPIVSLGLIVALMGYTTIKGYGFPTIAGLPALPLRVALEVMSREAAPPAKPNVVELAHSRPAFRKIVFVMDESVRGDYTTLGNPEIDTTPFLASYGRGLANFGVAVSSTNCSLTSRYILRYGIRPEELPEVFQPGGNHSGPTIWQYAKKAGLKTVYIDGYGNYGLHSGMNLLESGMIDEHIRIKAGVGQGYLRENEVADQLIAALRDPVPAFVYVDKVGVHTPYGDKYPPFRGKYVVDGSLKSRVLASYIGLKRDAPDNLLNMYKSAVNWSVDEFFVKLMRASDLGDTLIIYTSDHGQSLLDGRYEMSHCSITGDITKGEGLVPLLAITSNSEWSSWLAESAKQSANRFTHFEIFPTLLLAFGYDRSATAAKYGPSLLEHPKASRRFLNVSLRWVSAE